MKKVIWVVLIVLVMLFPAADSLADEKGAFRLDWFGGGAMGMTFIDITVDEEADVMSLWTNQTVRNVVVEKLEWFDYAVTNVIFRAEELISNEVLNIRIYQGEVMPTLRVTAINEKGIPERWYITESGENGDLLLIEKGTIESTLETGTLTLIFNDNTYLIPVQIGSVIATEVANLSFIVSGVFDNAIYLTASKPLAGYSDLYELTDAIMLMEGEEITLTDPDTGIEYVLVYPDTGISSININ